ncbi:MAG: DUF3881 family protein [Roseburia sp.]
MHKFLRAIGFSNLTRKSLEDVISEIIQKPSMMTVTEDSEGNEFAEFSKEFGDSFGIAVRGTYQEDDEFEVDYYYPYYHGSKITTREICEVEKHAEKESYAGICDEVKVGVTLIFYLQNVTDYLVGKKNKLSLSAQEGAILTALSTEGKILFPINKTEKQTRNIQKNTTDRNHLIAAAREGDEDAIENLTLEDMDTYSMLSRRIMNEDILSIVDNYFMPYGIESDQYSILAEIIDFSMVTNQYTNENVYVLELLCNDLNFSLCINQKDLLGEPELGRRFKGNIWMQGHICYCD